MARKLYKYHNLPLYLWLEESTAKNYRLYCENVTKIPTVISTDEHRARFEVDRKINRSLIPAYQRGYLKSHQEPNIAVPIVAVN